MFLCLDYSSGGNQPKSLVNSHFTSLQYLSDFCFPARDSSSLLNSVQAIISRTRTRIRGSKHKTKTNNEKNTLLDEFQFLSECRQLSGRALIPSIIKALVHKIPHNK